MRIPVRVEYFLGGLRPIVTIYIKSVSPNISGVVTAVIDTGSPHTILGSGDVTRMRISQVQMNKLIGAEKSVNLGGAEMKTRVISEVELKINGFPVIIPVQVPVKVLKGVPPPTILGIDFLEKGKFKFFFDVSNKESYLETN